MKLSNVSIMLVIAIFAAVVLSGCTTTSTGGPTATTTSGGATNTPSGGLTTLGSAIDFSKVHYYEYNMALKSDEFTSNSKIRTDYGVDYHGQNANKYTVTSIVGEGDTAMTTITEMYVDKNNKNLGGHMKSMLGDQVTYEDDIPATGSSDTTTSEPFMMSSGAALTSLGADSVTVPFGTYACTKYSYSTPTLTGTVWVAPNVPVPVKMETSSQYDTMTSTMTVELAGWG